MRQGTMYGMQEKNAYKEYTQENVIPDSKQEIEILKKKISQLQARLSLHEKKQKIWDEVIEEGYFIHEKFIIQEVNQGMERMSGYSKEELIGSHGKMLLTDESYARLKKMLTVGYSGIIELEMVTKNGIHIFVNTKGKTVTIGNRTQRAVIVQEITEIKKAQEDLRDSEEKHRLVSRLLSDYVYICKIKPNDAPVIEWVSGALENISGFTAEEIDQLHNGWFSLIHPEDVQKVAESVNFEYKDDRFNVNEYRIYDKKGKLRWLHDRSVPIHRDKLTQQITILGATKDVTQRKKIEEVLRQRNLDFKNLNTDLRKANQKLNKVNEQIKESESKYKSLIENSLIGIGISKGEKILYANKALLDIYGIKTFKEFASRKITDYMMPESRRLVKDRLKKYKSNIPQDNTFRYEIIRSDGEARIVQITTNEILYKGKKCRQALITDITAQTETENALKQAANIFNSIQTGLFIYRLDDLNDDRTLRMVAANPASTKLIGIEKDKMIGRRIDELFPLLRQKKIPQQYAEVVRSQIPIAFDDIHYEDDHISPAFFSVKVFPLPDQCVGISFENISARRKAEQDLVTRNQELNNFVYKVSHDLRAPLSSIKGLITLSKLEKNQVNYLPKIEERVNHLDDFIRDILSHSRNLNTAVIIEKLDLQNIIESCFKELEYLTNSTKLEKVVSMQGDTFFNDKIRITEICRNMISNAIKYQDLSKSKRYLKIEVKVNTKNAIIVFEDNGIGIEHDYLVDIFKMFFRATDKAEGSGIGLYIVQQAVEKLKGKISIESTTRSGSKFTLFLPNHKANTTE